MVLVLVLLVASNPVEVVVWWLVVAMHTDYTALRRPMMEQQTKMVVAVEVVEAAVSTL